MRYCLNCHTLVDCFRFVFVAQPAVASVAEEPVEAASDPSLVADEQGASAPTDAAVAFSKEALLEAVEAAAALPASPMLAEGQPAVSCELPFPPVLFIGKYLGMHLYITC
jgi:hypothetical protein